MVVIQTEVELFVERMALASELAQNAIEYGILCQIKVDPLGLIVDASCGKGDKRLSLRKIVGYSVLQYSKFDSLAFTVTQVIETLKNEARVRDGRPI